MTGGGRLRKPACRPRGAGGLITIALKTNVLATARAGVVACEARMVHGGRTTRLRDAEARHEESGEAIALFRCTRSVPGAKIMRRKAPLAKTKPHR